MAMKVGYKQKSEVEPHLYGFLSSYSHSANSTNPNNYR
jgi:hypothetical protein